MSFEQIRSLTHTLAFRLSLYYSIIFTISLLTAFLVFYLVFGSIIEKNRDLDLRRDLEELSSLLMIEGFDEMKDAIAIEIDSEGMDNMFIRVFNPEWKEIFSTDMTHWGSIGVSPDMQRSFKIGSGYFFETKGVHRREHMVRIIYGMLGPGVMVQMGEYLGKDEELMERLREGFAVLMALIIPLATIIGWFMGKRALQDVEQVSQTAIGISRGDLHRRVSVKTNAEEITRLASTFNTMLDRINTLMSGIRNITDDITHDLKKPLVRIRMIAERNLYTGNMSDNYDPDAARILEECDTLMQMINTMLDVSEAQAGVATLDMKPVDVTGIVRNAHELFYPLAEDRGLKFTLETPETCIITGDVHKIQRMISNLIDNAMKYTTPGGDVGIAITEHDDRVEIAFSDTGCGISDEDLPHIFERFYRCDRSRTSPGLGLGLTLARAIAISHGGDILSQSSPGKGSVFTIVLPVG